ncbi:DUF960 domain-containing protein [Lactobacillus selangorensis]|nr:DUF960 domain-containing protein [Lactobacillus selangorensis]
MFNAQHARFATFSVVQTLPGEIIDRVWQLIDTDLNGVVPLSNILKFNVENHNGRVTLLFSQADDATQIGFDLPFPYDRDYPDEILAYDDGENQTILLPNEVE